MSTEPSKAYSPAAVEKRIYQQWLDAGCFHADPNDTRQPFSVVIPPPNVTGALHLGHAINNTLQDILVRRKRMQGFNTLWMPGVDHAGIATQAVVERQIFEKEKKSRHDLGREELVRRIWEWKEQYGSRIVEQLKLMGCSCDWERQRFTLDDQCAAAVREWFFRLFKDGLIFRGKRLVNWDTHLQTAVADDEVYHETVKGHLWHVRYPIGDSGGKHLVVATTRPETMLADTAVAVHPEDERYRHLIGKQVALPLTGRTIPVIADGVLVKREFGTGCVKVTPGHDPNDYACYQRHPEIGIRNMMTPDGKVEKEFGKYAGMKLDAARKEVVADLEAAGLIEKIEEYQTDIGHSDRSKTPIQPYLSDQWFVKMGDLTDEEAARISSPHLRSVLDRASAVFPSRDREGAVQGAGGQREPLPHGRGSDNADLHPGLAQMAINAVCDVDSHYEGTDAVAARSKCDKLHIFPRRYVNTYRDWLSEKRDWCISRQLWWGHRILVWRVTLRISYTNRSTRQIREEHLRIMSELQSSLDELTRLANRPGDLVVCSYPDVAPSFCHLSAKSAEALNELRELLARWPRAKMVGLYDTDETPHPLPSNDPRFSASKRINELVNDLSEESDPDVLDTWFSSALWPLSTMGWPSNSLSDRPAFPSRDREGAVLGARGHREPLPHGRGSEKQSGSEKPRDSEEQQGSGRGDDAEDTPLAYLITFHTYGTWFRGSERGSVDWDHSIPGTPFIDSNERREEWEEQRMKGEPVVLGERQRHVVGATVREVAAHRGWTIHALNVRSNHVHMVVSGSATPEKMMNDLKSYATRRMVEQGVFPADTRAWSRHGSTRYLWDEASVELAGRYVVEQQGDDLTGSARMDGVVGMEHPEPLPHGRGSEIEGGSEIHSAIEPNLLRVFYPTSVLSTAREIITLWVARMVIAGLYNVGRVPFRDVFIHPVIQDGHGKPMKKMAGNGLDPVDIIDMYGADALRFTLASMTTETQDVRVPVKRAKLEGGREVNTSEKFELGRNFCNKLWQAATGFVLPNVADVKIERHEGTEARRHEGGRDEGTKGQRDEGSASQRHTARRPEEMPLYDRWIRTRLNHCIAAVDAALEGYQFAQAAQTIRDFFWTEFCDWYLEESKIRIHGAAGGGCGPEEANDVKVVLLQTLDITLCLLHPFVPFITEAIWEEIAKRVPRHFELIAPDGWKGETPSIILAPWPRVHAPYTDSLCERDVGDIIQPIVTSLRQARTEINASRSKSGRPAVRTLPTALVHADAATCAVIAANKDMIARLGGVEALEFGPDLAKPKAVRADVKQGLQIFVPLGDLVDLAVETKRLQDELANKQAALGRAKAQLANEGFVTRATPEAVEESRQRAVELERQCGLIDRHIADLT